MSMTETNFITEPTAEACQRPMHKLAPSVELAHLLRVVIYLARDILAALPTMRHVEVMSRFGTLDYRLIVARITQGLMLARVLEARVAENADRIDIEASVGRGSGQSADDTALGGQICGDLGIAAVDGLCARLSGAMTRHRRTVSALLNPVPRGGIHAPQPPGMTRVQSPAHAPLLDMAKTFVPAGFPVLACAATGPP